MKKILVIGTIAVAIVAALAFGLTNWAYAQDDLPVCPFCGEGSWMGGRGGFRGQVDGDEYGPMHDYMFPAIAEAFGLTETELEAAHDAGKTMWDIAQEKGFTFEEFQTLMLNARTQAFEKMVADGVISQEQATWMLSHMNGAQGGGYGPGMRGAGGCGMYDGDEYPSGGYGRGMRGGGRWNNQP